jgi:hypothetical protein
MTLKNSWHTKMAIGVLLNDEVELDRKLDLLTEIGLTASNPETFAICEEFRHSLCYEKDEKGRNDNLSGAETQRIYKRDQGKEKLNEMDGVK